jgi:DNA-binding transcriptional LysR family regulator
MELRHLRYFLAVAEERQLTRAAARLHIQQPPLSQQIQALEQELGFALFTRLARGVELTPAGTVFAQDVRAILEALEQGIAKAARIAAGQLGSVRIALTSSSAFHPLTPAAIREFRERYPDIAIELNEINAAEIIERMLSGRIDAAILRKPTDTPASLQFDLLLEEEMVLVLPAGHALLARVPKGRKLPRIALEVLAGETFIFVRRPGAPGMYADFLRACEAVGFTPSVASEVPRMVSAINLVAAGAGVTLVPASMQRYTQESVVYCQLGRDQAFTAPLHLVTLRDSANPAAVCFAQTIVDYAHRGAAVS